MSVTLFACSTCLVGTGGFDGVLSELRWRKRETDTARRVPSGT